MDAQDFYLRDFYFSNPLLQIRIRLHFGSTSFKDIFGQKLDIIYTRHLNRTSTQLLIFNDKTNYVIKKQMIKSEDEYGFVGENLRIP